MCHMNGVGTYYTKLISGLITINHMALTQQAKLAQHMSASPPSTPDAELSARQHFHLQHHLFRHVEEDGERFF